jgi:arylsulfatase A-like enzyme
MFTDDEPKEQFNEKRAESALADAQTVSWCIEQLGDIKKQPFFMTCGIHRPHTPWDIPKKYFDQFPLESIKIPEVLTNDLDDVPPQGKEFAKPDGVHKQIVKLGLWQDRVRAYLAAIAYMDAQVGRLLDTLNKSPYATNTIVVFVGDNGWHLGQKEHWGKVTLWTEATRVPMIWSAPNVTKAGAKCEQAVDLMSIYPTLCELTGIPRPKHVEGVSIKPLLVDPAADWTTPALSTMLKGNHTLVTRDWRYIHYADGTEELYNERTDPHDWTNIITSAQAADVKKSLAKYLPAKNAEPVAETDPATKKKGKQKKKQQSVDSE